MQFFSISQKISYLYIPNIQMPHWGITIYEKRNHPSHQSIRQGRQALSLCHRLSGQPSFHRATKRAFLLDQGAITKKDLTPDDLMKADHKTSAKTMPQLPKILDVRKCSEKIITI